MNFISDLYWTIKWKLEDAIYAIKDKFSKGNNCDSFLNEEYVSEVQKKPKKKAKKKSVKKTKKSV